MERRGGGEDNPVAAAVRRARAQLQTATNHAARAALEADGAAVPRQPRITTLSAQQRAAVYSVWVPLVDVPAVARGGSVAFCNRTALPAGCSEAGAPLAVEKPCLTGASDGTCERAMERGCAALSHAAGDAV